MALRAKTFARNAMFSFTGALTLPEPLAFQQ